MGQGHGNHMGDDVEKQAFLSVEHPFGCARGSARVNDQGIVGFGCFQGWRGFRVCRLEIIPTEPSVPTGPAHRHDMFQRRQFRLHGDNLFHQGDMDKNHFNGSILENMGDIVLAHHHVGGDKGGTRFIHTEIGNGIFDAVGENHAHAVVGAEPKGPDAVGHPVGGHVKLPVGDSPTILAGEQKIPILSKRLDGQRLNGGGLKICHHQSPFVLVVLVKISVICRTDRKRP